MSVLPAQLRAWGRRIKSALFSRVVILLYHRIARETYDPFDLCVSPEHFAEHMQVVKDSGLVMPLAQVVQGVACRRLPRRGIAITFDDGYLDNLTVAKPVLERLGLPATVFVTSDVIGRQREFWWDQLQRLVCGANGSICVDAGSGVREYRVADEAGRTSTLQALWEALVDLPHPRRQAILDELHATLNVPTDARSTHRALHADEIVQLAEGGLISVGGHTATHPRLTAHSPEVQREEIVSNRRWLGEVVGRPPEVLAYPFGEHDDHSIAAAREAGYAAACACMEHAVRNGSELFRLTRADTSNWHGEEFARRLRAMFVQ